VHFFLPVGERTQLLHVDLSVFEFEEEAVAVAADRLQSFLQVFAEEGESVVFDLQFEDLLLALLAERLAEFPQFFLLLGWFRLFGSRFGLPAVESCDLQFQLLDKCGSLAVVGLQSADLILEVGFVLLQFLDFGLEFVVLPLDFDEVVLDLLDLVLAVLVFIFDVVAFQFLEFSCQVDVFDLQLPVFLVSALEFNGEGFHLFFEFHYQNDVLPILGNYILIPFLLVDRVVYLELLLRQFLVDLAEFLPLFDFLVLHCLSVLQLQHFASCSFQLCCELIPFSPQTVVLHQEDGLLLVFPLLIGDLCLLVLGAQLGEFLLPGGEMGCQLISLGLEGEDEGLRLLELDNAAVDGRY
jgi:hypothetical protein